MTRSFIYAILATVLVAVSPAFAEDPPPPPPVDPVIDELLKLNPTEVKARLDALKAEAAKLAAEAAEVKKQADAAQGKADSMKALLDAVQASATAINAAFTAEAQAKKEAEEKAAMAAAKPAEPEMAAPAMAEPAMAEPAMAAAPAEGAEATPATAKTPTFNYRDHILPVFRSKCGGCHNPNAKRSGLNLLNMRGVMEGGSSGQVLELGSADGSRLFRLITGQETPQMPLNGEPLDAETIEMIRVWISEGAPEQADSKVMVAKAMVAEDRPVFVAAEITDGPPPMPEVELEMPETLPTIPARSIAANPRSSLMAVGGFGQVLLYNMAENTLLGTLPFAEGEIYDLSFSVNGELLVAAGGMTGDFGCAVVWNVRTGERVGRFGEQLDTVLAADISPDHRLIAVGGPNRVVQVFSVPEGKELYQLTDHTEWIYDVRFTPDGEILATADRGSGLYLWQAANGRAVEQLRGHGAAIFDLAYTADSNVLASASLDGSVRLWDTWKYKQIRSFTAHGSGVLSVDVSPAGHIVTTGVDGNVKRWDLAGKELNNYGNLGDWGYAATFVNDGTRVVAGSWTGAIEVWDTESKELVAGLSTAVADSSRVASAAATPAE